MAALAGVFSSVSAWWNYLTVSLQRTEEQASWADQYNMLRAYTLNNGLYEVLSAILESTSADIPKQRPLRNPAGRVVNFYAGKIWPGTLPDALPIITDNELIIEPIQQVWAWSNWNANKQVCARWFAMYGDMFLKVSTRTDATGAVVRVYHQNLEPQIVTSFDVDERRYLTYVRLDIPQTRRDDRGKIETYMRTERWTKEQHTVWEHDLSSSAEYNQLGTPLIDVPLTSYGIDFIPIVWQPFIDIGDERGVGAFTQALDKIDECNRQATRLHQMLYRHNKALWALKAGGMDANGRPLPPPRLGGSSDDETLELDDNDIVKLPGVSDLVPLVPPIDYAAALSVLNAQLDELEQDLPELAYFKLRSMGEISGRAARLLLGDAADRLSEARGNAEAALIRANQMALTVGQAVGLFDDGIGRFGAGAFEHTFAERPLLFGDDQGEETEVVAQMVQAGIPLRTALRRMGWSEEELAELDADRQAEQVTQRSFADAVLSAAERDFDQGIA